MDLKKDEACKIDRQNKKCNCARKSGRKKNNVGTDKEEENKLAGPLAKKELPAEGCSRTGSTKLWLAGFIRPANFFYVARFSRVILSFFWFRFLSLE